MPAAHGAPANRWIGSPLHCPVPVWPYPAVRFSVAVSSEEGAWWTSDNVWTLVQVVGIGAVAVLGIVINVLCAFIWSGRPALRSHSTRYVYNMLAANLLCAGVLAPLDVAVLVVAAAAPPRHPTTWPGGPGGPVGPSGAGPALGAGPDASGTASEGAAAAAIAAGPMAVAAALVGSSEDIWSGSWYFWLCEANRFAQGLAVQVSVFSVLLVALDRHKAVLSPLHYHRMATRQRSTILIVSNWLLTPVMTILFETRLIPYSQWIHFAIGEYLSKLYAACNLILNRQSVCNWPI